MKPSVPPSDPLGLAGRLTVGTLVLRLVDVDACKTFVAAPPVDRYVAALHPVSVDGHAALLDVFLVEVPQVVPVVVTAAEGLPPPDALGVVASVRLLGAVRVVSVLVVTVKVGTTLEDLVASGIKAHHRRVSVLLGAVDVLIL